MKRARYLCLLIISGGLLYASSLLYAAEDNSREIPLSSITTTSKQDGLQKAARSQIGETEKEGAGKPSWYLDKIYEQTSGMGASNVFLVDAPDINGAISATSRVFIGGCTADKPATLNEPNPPKGNYWLVVYLGVSGSNPPEWLVDKATVKSTEIRFAYHELGARTKDEHQYFYWVPLKTLPEGAYQLELFDTEADAVTLSRCVTVGK